MFDMRVELAAQAIHKLVCDRSGRGREWKAIPESLKASFREEARAALAAADTMEVR
ncbi:hypothetical protein HAP48_0043130 [Bradyrhizobium septentrionale]|uniref:Uncharacterized protein n=1 Tax=Bradyrhizobium septentrionale TaxID=1404411 RepID=A0A973W2S1_9BRAD|nr:hypothetical protein [Bradyrhizobium septentrionale]UGY15253.1 hypothetical protein HAP48_0043130 [Bradyrhizobium septentrionale]UGY23840.1 hypothetical protein HU675_0038815 [Bradyrhizobium septentrionale]